MSPRRKRRSPFPRDSPFGIVYVDFPTGRRTPKASAAFFSRVARENAVPPLPAAWPF